MISNVRPHKRPESVHLVASKAVGGSALALHLPVSMVSVTAPSMLRSSPHTGPAQTYGANHHEESSLGHRRNQRAIGGAMATSGTWGRACTPHTLLRRLRSYPGSFVSVGHHRISPAHGRNRCDFLLAQVANRAENKRAQTTVSHLSVAYRHG